MRERRKEPRKGSEIDPETVCVQTVGAPPPSAFGAGGGAEDRRQKTEDRLNWRAVGAVILLSSVLSLQSSAPPKAKGFWRRGDCVPFV